MTHEAPRASVFISYSRKDRAFAVRLRDALIGENVDASLDIHDILPGEDWKARLSNLILDADTVVLCLSPSFIGSDICTWEVEEAQRLGKRLLPVVAADPPDDNVPADLKRLNYTWMRNDREFARGLKRLVEAINTDSAWMRENTRLTQFAENWQRHARSEDLLLRGSQLEDAEQWLWRRPQQAPEPTSLQLEHIDESRRWEKVRAKRERKSQERIRILMRMTIGLVAVAGLITVAWGFHTVWQAHATSKREANVFLSRAQAAFNQGYCDRALRYAVAGLPGVGATWPQYRSQDLEGALARFASACRFHSKLSGGFYGLSMSADGKLVATRDGDRMAVRRIADGASIAEVECPSETYFTGTAFSSDGSRIAVICSDNIVRVWKNGDAHLIATLEGHDNYVESVVFSPDDTRVLTTSWDKTARIWSAADGKQLSVLRGHTGLVSVGRFSRDGRLIVTASGSEIAGTVTVGFTSDTLARIWDAETGALKFTLKGHKRNIGDARFSNDGTRVVTASYDATARLWSTQSGDLVSILEGHTRDLRSAAFDPSDTIIATASADQTARLWDTATGNQLTVLNGHTGEVWKAVFSPDGERLVTGSADKTARIWDIAGGTVVDVLRGHHKDVKDVGYSADGHWIATAATDGSTRIWHAASRPAKSAIGQGGIVWEYSALHLASGRAVLALPDGVTHLFDWRTMRQVATLHKGNNKHAVSTAFNADGSQIVTASVDGTAHIWDGQTGKPVLILSGHDEPLTRAAFSPDGRRIVTASHDKTARIWDAAAGKTLRVLSGHTMAVFDASFSPDGTRILTASSDGTARVWDATTGRLVMELKQHALWLSSAAFSPDGKRAITNSSDKTSIVWDLETGNIVRILRGHDSVVTKAVYSPNGKQVVTISWDGFARLWDAATGVEIAQMKADDRQVTFAIFSPDGKRFLSASSRGELRVWTLDEVTLIDPAQRRQFICRNRLRGAQAFTAEEMRDEILRGNTDLKNPCDRYGPLSREYYKRLIEAWRSPAPSAP